MTFSFLSSATGDLLGPFREKVPGPPRVFGYRQLLAVKPEEPFREKNLKNEKFMQAVGLKII